MSSTRILPQDFEQLKLSLRMKALLCVYKEEKDTLIIQGIESEVRDLYEKLRVQASNTLPPEVFAKKISIGSSKKHPGQWLINISRPALSDFPPSLLETPRGKLGQLPQPLEVTFTTEYLENKDIRNLFQTSKAYHAELLTKGYATVWIKKLRASGCEEKMLDAVINRNVIRDYHRLYAVFTSLHPTIRAQINKPWQLLCLSGEEEAINNAFEHEPRAMLAESQWYFTEFFRHDQTRKHVFNTRQLIALSCSPQGLKFAASHPQLKKLNTGVEENINIAVFAGSSPALRFFFNSLSSQEQNAYCTDHAKESDLFIGLQSGCSELMRILQPHILPLRTHHRRGLMLDMVTTAIASDSKTTLYEVMKFWDPSLQPTQFETLNWCDIKTFHYNEPYNPLPGIIMSGNVSLLNSVLQDPKFKPEWKNPHMIGFNLINIAAASGHVKMIEYVWENFKEPNPFGEIWGWTTLHYAVHSRSLESVKKILSLMKADPHFATLPVAIPPAYRRHNVFHIAASRGAPDILELLFNAPEFKNIELTPSFDLLQSAVDSGSIDTVIKLRQLFHQRQVALDMGTERNQSLVYGTFDILHYAVDSKTYHDPSPHFTLLKDALSLPPQELSNFNQRPLPKDEKKPTLVTLKHTCLLIGVGLLIVASLAAGGIIPLTFTALALAVTLAVGAAGTICLVGRYITSSLASAKRKRILKAAAAPAASPDNNHSLSSVPLVSPQSTHARVNTSISSLSSSNEAKRTSTEDSFAAQGSGNSLLAPRRFSSHAVLQEDKENNNDNDTGLDLGLSLGRGTPSSSISN